MMTFTRLSGAIGADVHGLDLSQPLNAQEVRTILDALDRHHVLFFREQSILTIGQHMALARNFGLPEPAPFKPRESEALVLTLDQYEPKGSQAANFHSDNTFRPSPPLGALLQAQIEPAVGGDTCFALNVRGI